MSNTIDEYTIKIFSIVNHLNPCYPYMFITENYSSKFMIMSFWDPGPKFPAKNGILKNSLYVSLDLVNRLLKVTVETNLISELRSRWCFR